MKKIDHSGTTEEKWYKFWEDKGLFTAHSQSEEKPYSLLMPPPNLTGDPHLGHAMQHVILDAIARFKRMQGYDVLLLPGVDHAGIQFEGTLNKRLEKEGLSKYKLGREKWLEKAWQFKDEVYASFNDTWSVFGISADWSREVFTMEPKVQKAVLEQFIKFWDEDLLYKGAYIVQWCPKCGTAIEDVEMEYEERKEQLYFINYEIIGKTGEYITIATARPETIAADVAIAVHPNHSKYSKYVIKEGDRMMVHNPFTDTHIPIIEDSRVKTDFGTGALKITPGHDLLDYEIGKDANLPILHAVGKDGRITDLDKELQGLKIAEARKKAAEKLQALDLIERVEEYTHSVPVCERCKTTVEPLISEEWFVTMQPLAKKALTKINEVNFIPDSYKQILSDWIEGIHDWSISRSLWWGHRIPVWYCQASNPNHLVGKDQDIMIALDAPEGPCVCGALEWVQDEQVLDTWFSSGLWPLATLGWPKENNEISRYFPWDFEISGPEIKYMWIARMIMLSIWHTGQIPFKNMFFHGTIRDPQGRKMSKSLGNGVDPKDLINQWGTDATRMALYSYSAPGRDGKTSRQVMDERCKNFRNFGTKVRNIYRFIYELKPDGAKGLLDINEWTPSDPMDVNIAEAVEELVHSTTKNIESFNLHLAVDEIYNFTWHTLADKYIEQSKGRRAEAQPCLEYVFITILNLLHPFMPFLTEELYQNIPGHGKSIMTEVWPD